MAFCDAVPWNMTLILNEAPGVDERFTFNLMNDGTGTVNLPPGGARMSDLIWSCRSFGTFGTPGARALMTFHFRFRRIVPRTGTLEVGAILVGIARQVGGSTIFRGRLSTFSPDPDVPGGGSGQLATLQVDTGDTGTGNGTQT